MRLRRRSERGLRGRRRFWLSRLWAGLLAWVEGDWASHGACGLTPEIEFVWADLATCRARANTVVGGCRVPALGSALAPAWAPGALQRPTVCRVSRRPAT